MERPIFDGGYSAEASAYLEGFHRDVVKRVADAVSQDDVVVVGMAQNPHVRNARKALDEAGIAFTYLEFGSYFSQWKERLAIKMWSGWPTFPQVYVHGVLVGGNSRLRQSIADGSLQGRIDAGRATPSSDAI